MRLTLFCGHNSFPSVAIGPHSFWTALQAIIYVVDSSDVDRLTTSREEFHAMLEEEELRTALVLVYANKQDIAGALSEAQVCASNGMLHHFLRRDSRSLTFTQRTHSHYNEKT